MTRNELLRYIFWEWVEPIGSALCIALLVMKFVMALYVIPTGSMQPTLHGKGDYPNELGDKVLVNKFVYDFQKPERWDVIVFEFPYISIKCENCDLDLQDYQLKTEDEAYEKAICPTCPDKPKNFSFMKKDYIKRCVAKPGDEISIRDGNVVLKQDGVWKHSVKTDLAQDALWVPVFDSHEEEHLAALNYFWKSGADLSGWRVNAPLTLKGEQDQLMLFYEKEHLRGYGDKGVHATAVPRGAPIVGDVKMVLDFDKAPSSGKLALEISWNHTPHILNIDLDAKKLEMKLPNQVLHTANYSELSSISFARVDGHLWLDIGEGNQKLAIPDLNPSEGTKTIMPKIHYMGSGIEIARVQVLRDIFYEGGSKKYFTGPDSSYKVLPGTYFAMGDNSYFSYDSRSWGAVPEEYLIGKALTVLLPFSRIKLIY